MRRRNECGSALVELTWLTVLLLVPLTWIVVALAEVQAGAFAVTTAARSAGRAYVLAPDPATGRARAEEAARVALADQGLGSAAAGVRISCTPQPARCLAAESVVTVRVSTGVPLPLPNLLGGDRPNFALDATHTVPVGRFRESR